GIHLEQFLHVLEAESRDAVARLLQHLSRDVDPGHLGIGTEMRQGKTGADADFENALAGPRIRDPHRILAPGMENRSEYEIIGAREKSVGLDRILQIHSFSSVLAPQIRAYNPQPSLRVLLRPMLKAKEASCLE